MIVKQTFQAYGTDSNDSPYGQPAERGETPELTLDEINEEIREVRRLRKERNGICSH